MGVADVGAQSGAQTPRWPVDPITGAAGGLLSTACPAGTPELSEAQRRELEKQLKAREELLLPMYYQVAVHFADLHDTPGRMQEKGVITVSLGISGKGLGAGGFAAAARRQEAKSSPAGLGCSSMCCSCPGCCSLLQPSRAAFKPSGASCERAVAAHQLLFFLQRRTWAVSPFLQDILEWKNARSFLYWRLRRLLLEEVVKAEVLKANSELSPIHVQSMLRRWFMETEGAAKVRPSPASRGISAAGGVLRAVTLLPHCSGVPSVPP